MEGGKLLDVVFYEKLSEMVFLERFYAGNGPELMYGGGFVELRDGLPW